MRLPRGQARPHCDGVCRGWHFQRTSILQRTAAQPDHKLDFLGRPLGLHPPPIAAEATAAAAEAQSKRRPDDLAGAILGPLPAGASSGEVRWNWARGYHQIVRPRPPIACDLFLRALPPALTGCLSTTGGSEWAVNQHRDSYALYCGVDSLSMFFAVAENESIGRVKFSCLQACTSTSPAAARSRARSPPLPPGSLPRIRAPRPNQPPPPPCRLAENDSALRAATTEGRGLMRFWCVEYGDQGVRGCPRVRSRRVSPPRVAGPCRRRTAYVAWEGPAG